MGYFRTRPTFGHIVTCKSVYLAGMFIKFPWGGNVHPVKLACHSNALVICNNAPHPQGNSGVLTFGSAEPW